MKPTNSFPRALLVSTLIAWLFVSCTAAPATPTQPPLQPVTLQLQWVTQAQFAGYYVALDKGWYREEGLDVTIKPGGPNIIAADAVSSGVADFGTSLLADIIVAIQNGKSLVSISQVQQSNGLLLVAWKSSGIATPHDFTDKKVGVWLGGWEAQFNALVAKENIAPDSYELVAQGFSMDPFLAHELDVASAMIYNEFQVVLESGVSADELNIIDYADYGLAFPGDVLFTSTDTAKNQPDLCVRMVRASLRGWQYAIDHPDEAAEIVIRYDQSKTITLEHQVAMMNEIARLVQVSVRQLGFTDRTDVRRTVDTLFSYGVLTSSVNPDDVFTNSFWEQAQSGLK